MPFDTVAIPTGDKSAIDKFITWRESPKDPQSIDVLVKYKVRIHLFANVQNMSYNDAEWLSRQQIEEELKQGKTRVKKLLEKTPFELQWNEDEPFNPSFCKVSCQIRETVTE